MKVSSSAAFLPVACLVAAVAGSRQEQESTRRDVSWEEVLGEPQGEWPYWRTLRWHDDLDSAQRVAREENRPVFVVVRCFSNPHSQEFDSKVSAASEQLADLLPRFVTVQLSTVHDLDMRRLALEGYQDLDLTWWSWFLSPEGRVYGVYGGSQSRESPTSISIQGLAAAMERVLDHHSDPRRPGWIVDGPAPAQGRAPRTAYDLAGWKSWSRKFVDPDAPACLRCHEVAQILRQPAIDQRRFDKRRDLEIWPALKNIGITSKWDDCLRVRSVQPKSPAAKAGLRAGDLLAAGGDRKLFSSVDLRGVLHRWPHERRAIPIQWKRDGKLMGALVELPEGWRRTPVAWRPSVAWGNVGAHPGFDRAGELDARERARLGIAANAMAVRPIFTMQKPTYAQLAGLQASHTIVAVGGNKTNLSGQAFMTWFRLTFEPGDAVQLSVRAGTDPAADITYTARGFPR